MIKRGTDRGKKRERQTFDKQKQTQKERETYRQKR